MNYETGRTGILPVPPGVPPGVRAKVKSQFLVIGSWLLVLGFSSHLFMPAPKQPRVLRVLSSYRHPTGRRAGHAGARVLPPVLPLRFLRVLMFKSTTFQRPLRHREPEVIAGRERGKYEG